MNQNILFADLQNWDGDKQAVNFSAQQGGALINCWVSLSWLKSNTESALTTSDEIVEAFIACRFDIEELVEEMIEDEDFDSNGEIFIG